VEVSVYRDFSGRVINSSAYCAKEKFVNAVIKNNKKSCFIEARFSKCKLVSTSNGQKFSLMIGKIPKEECRKNVKMKFYF